MNKDNSNSNLNKNSLSNNYNNNKKNFEEFEYIKSLDKMDKNELVSILLTEHTYTFFIRLLDLDLNPTDWLTWTNPISVKEGSFNFESPPDNNDGTYIDPTAENFTAKSITLILNNLDTSFKYYEKIIPLQ